MENNKKPSSGPQDSFQDPKTQYLFSLNNDMEAIYKELIERPYSGACKMCIFIQRLKIPDSFEEMKMIQTKWTPDRVNWSLGLGKYHSPGMKEDEIWVLWRKLSSFMNETYYRGWEGGKPQENRPTGKL
jgi:hypothetical protein